MKEILWNSPKYGDFVIQVDDEDYDQVKDIVTVNYLPESQYPKVRTLVFPTTSLARYLMKPQDTYLVVDHIDGNPLNNQKANLRICTQRENARNRKKQTNSTNPYRGISRHKNKWRADISFHLGVFNTPEEAAKAYDAAIIKLHGKFAKTNFPIES